MLLNQFAPPIVKTFVRKAFFPAKTYANFESAQRALRLLKDYDNPALIDVIFHKTNYFIQNITRLSHQPVDIHHLFLLNLIGLMASQKTLTVLDFGGAFGTHYFVVKHFFPHLTFDWKVVELPSVVQKGAVFANEELTFIDIKNDFDHPVAGKFDLVLTSATLQHMPDPRKTLAFLCKHRAPYLALLRVGLHRGPNDMWFIHKAQFKDCGPGDILPQHYSNEIAAFPFCLMAEHAFTRLLSDYNLILSTLDSSGTLPIPDFPLQGSNRLYAAKAF